VRRRSNAYKFGLAVNGNATVATTSTTTRTVHFDSANVSAVPGTTLLVTNAAATGTNHFKFYAGGFNYAGNLILGGNGANNMVFLESYNTNDTLPDQIFSGVISGAGKIYKNIEGSSPGGNLIISNAANTFSGGVELRAGYIGLGANSPLGTNSVIFGFDFNPLGFYAVDAPRTLTNDIYADVLSTAASTAAGSTNLYFKGSQNLTLSGRIFIHTNVQFFIVNNTALTTFSGIVSNAAATSLGIAKLGAGTLALSGNNAYSGDTFVNAGILRIGANNVIPDGAGKGNVSVSSTLDMNTFSETVNGLSGAGVIDTVAGGTPVLTVGNNNISSSFGGVMQNTAGTLGLTKTGSGVFTLTGVNTYTGNTVVGTGTLALSGATVMLASPSIAVSAGALFDVSAVTGGFTLGAAQTVSGFGSVKGTLTNNGTISPGASIGTLTFSNAPVLNGTVLMELNRTNAQTADKLVLTVGTLTYGGALIVTNLGDALQAGDTFTLFAAANYSGAFTNTTLPSLGAGLSWNTSQLAANGTIQVVSLPAVTVVPASTNIVYGSSVVLTASASGSAPLSYQWYDKNTNAISGATNSTLPLTVPAVAASGNYSVIVTNAYGSATNHAAVTVTPAALGVTANDTNRVYGVADPAFTATINGFVNGETIAVLSGSPSLTTTTSNTSPVGTYPITAAVGSLTAANYSFVNFTNGTLTITPAALSITASNISKIYGQTVTFAGTEFSSTGLVGSDSVTSVTLTSGGAVNTATVSGYAIVPSAATGSGLTNYTITYNNGTLTVNPAALSVTANSTSKTYGQTVTFAGTEFSTSGLLLSDSVTSVTLTSAGAASTAPAASYTIVPSAATGSGLGNYSVTYINGMLTVNPLAVILDGTRAYDGTTNASFSILTVTNFIGSDVVTVASGTGGLAAASVGSQPITSFGTLALGGAQGTNYTLAGASGAVNITIATAGGTLTSSANPVGYGGSVTFTDTLAAGATGYVLFNTNNVLLSSNNLSGGAAISVALNNLPRGTNAITAIYGGDSNYSSGTNSLAQIVTNHPPVTTDVTYYRNGGIDLRITIADLLTNVTDVDADTITLSTGTSTNGVTLFNGFGFLLYHNTNNVLDQFTYTADDGNGGTATGNVNIVLNPFLTGQNASISGGVSPITVSFHGIPGYNYGVQRKTNMMSAWVTILTTNAPANGAFEWADDFSDLGYVVPAAPGSAYYRIQWIP
jgi:autotransporter-associated beta strand protein